MKKRVFNDFDIVASVIMIIVGILFLTVPFDVLIGFIFVILGIVIIVTNLPACIYYLILSETDKRFLPYGLGSLVTCIIGSVFIFYHSTVMTIIIAVWLIICPILRLILDKGNRKDRLKKELPYIIIGVLLCFTPFEGIINIIVMVFGGLILLYGVIDLVLSLLYLRKNDNNDNNPNTSGGNPNKDYIDVDVKEV